MKQVWKFTAYVPRQFYVLLAVRCRRSRNGCRYRHCWAGAGRHDRWSRHVDNGLKTIVLEKMLLSAAAATTWKAPLPLARRRRKRTILALIQSVNSNGVMDFHHWRINAKALNHWLKQTGPTMDWLADHNIHFGKR